MNNPKANIYIKESLSPCGTGSLQVKSDPTEVNGSFAIAFNRARISPYNAEVMAYPIVNFFTDSWLLFIRSFNIKKLHQWANCYSLYRQKKNPCLLIDIKEQRHTFQSYAFFFFSQNCDNQPEGPHGSPKTSMVQ